MPEGKKGGHRVNIQAQPTRSDEIQTCLTIALAWVAGRRARDQAFEGSLFLNPAWDILLDLYINHVQGRKECVSNVCIASSAPATTVSRWIALLEKQGLIERASDPNDKRRTLLGLSADGLRRMEQALLASSNSNARLGLGRSGIAR